MLCDNSLSQALSGLMKDNNGWMKNRSGSDTEAFASHLEVAKLIL